MLWEEFGGGLGTKELGIPTQRRLLGSWEGAERVRGQTTAACDVTKDFQFQAPE